MQESLTSKYNSIIYESNSKLLDFRHEEVIIYNLEGVSSKICVLRLPLHIRIQAIVFRVHRKLKTLVPSSMIDT